MNMNPQKLLKVTENNFAMRKKRQQQYYQLIESINNGSLSSCNDDEVLKLLHKNDFIVVLKLFYNNYSLNLKYTILKS